jgi:hypothetical protein
VKASVWKTAVALAIAGAAAFWWVSGAQASHLSVRITEPTPATVGQASALNATVVSADTGQPVAGVPVTFYAHASFGKTSGFMEIGRAVTDASGIAAISYVPRESGEHEIRVDYTGTGSAASEQTTGTVAVGGSDEQMYVQTAGIHVPGLNAGLIMLVLSIIWAILFGVGLTVVRIAGARSSESGVPVAREAAVSMGRQSPA